MDIDLFIKLGINAKEESSIFFTWILHLDELNKLRSDLNTTSDTIECLYIKIVNKHFRKIILNLSYRPPQGDTTLFEKHFQDILLRHDACKMLLLIMGNFTINLDFENNKKVQSFVNLILLCEIVPVINKPTCITKYTSTAIDHMFTNSIIKTEVKSAIIKPDVSDHFPVLFVAKVKLDVNIKTEQYTWNIISLIIV